MKFFDNYSIVFSMVMTATCLSVGAQTGSFADRIAQKEEEIEQIRREEKEHNERVCIRLANKEIFRTTGKCVGCDLADTDLISVIKELNKNEMAVDLSGANLTRAVMCGVDLKKANFVGANLTGTSFHKSDLSRANLTGAYLAYTNFEKANLSYATLRGVSMDKLGLTLNLKETNIDGVKTDKISVIQLDLLHRCKNMFGK